MAVRVFTSPLTTALTALISKDSRALLSASLTGRAVAVGVGVECGDGDAEGEVEPGVAAAEGTPVGRGAVGLAGVQESTSPNQQIPIPHDKNDRFLARSEFCISLPG